VVPNPRREIVDALVAKEIQNIKDRYGDEFGGGINWKPYHNASHTQSVVNAAQRIGRALLASDQINEVDFDNLLLAAAFHDHEQDLGPGQNESQSALAATEAILENPGQFTLFDINHIRKAISATQIAWQGQILHQLVDPSDVVQLALADADLAGLGQDFGVRYSLLLNLEISGAKVGPTRMHNFDPDRLSTLQNLRLSVALFGNHQYWLPEAAAWLTPGLAQNQKKLERLIPFYESGKFTYRDLFSLI